MKINKKVKKTGMTNEQLLEEVKKFMKENPQVVTVPHIVQYPVYIQGHSHCTCQFCNPRVYPQYPYYGIQSGGTTIQTIGTLTNGSIGGSYL